MRTPAHLRPDLPGRASLTRAARSGLVRSTEEGDA
jgi:hypothetical protein